VRAAWRSGHGDSPAPRRPQAREVTAGARRSPPTRALGTSASRCDRRPSERRLRRACRRLRAGRAPRGAPRGAPQARRSPPFAPPGRCASRRGAAGARPREAPRSVRRRRGRRSSGAGAAARSHARSGARGAPHRTRRGSARARPRCAGSRAPRRSPFARDRGAYRGGRPAGKRSRSAAARDTRPRRPPQEHGLLTANLQQTAEITTQPVTIRALVLLEPLPVPDLEEPTPQADKRHVLREPRLLPAVGRNQNASRAIEFGFPRARDPEAADTTQTLVELRLFVERADDALPHRER